MGVFSKIAFWKKKNDFGDFEKDLGLDKDFGLGNSETGMSPDLGMGMETQEPHKYPSYQQLPQGFQPYHQNLQQEYQQPVQQMSDRDYINSKSLEVISSKLDALKAAIESINQRLANIEAIAKGEQEEKKRRYF